jgi:uncharacterized protein
MEITASGAPRPDARPPLPIRQFILKIHSRCDLACDYCYVYTMADQRWRSRPPHMARRTMVQTGRRIAEHIRRHRVPAVEVILHGGEPLLAGPARIAACVAEIRAAVGDAATVRFGIQTNGVRLDTGYLDLLRRLGVQISVSVDGDGVAQDRHRRDRGGRSSYPAVTRALRELGRVPYRPLFAGLLCTIDLANDPISTYEALLSFAPPAVDFLLPHGNWSQPPPGRDPRSPGTPYADWLIAVFDRWYEAPRLETRIRLFEEIMAVLLGGQSRVEGVGLSPAAMVVVETDGAIEESDMLTSAYPGAGATGLHVDRDSFDAVLSPTGTPARQRGQAALAPSCRSCDLHRACGGGLYPHRYRRGHGFTNPSVYCPDLYRLIGHVRHRLTADLDALHGCAV